jgi:CheY-specific phosphatase CheX
MNKLQTNLFKAGLKVFEDMGFMLPNSELDSEQARAEFHSAVSIEFNGPMKGKLILTINGDILPALTSNMLGEEEAPSALQQEDALKELANVICGNLLPLIAGPTALFQLGEPRLRSIHEDLNGNLQAVAQQAIGLENGRAELSLFLSEGSCSQVH